MFLFFKLRNIFISFTGRVWTRVKLTETVQIRLRGGERKVLGKISTVKARNFTLPNLYFMLNISSNPIKLKIVPGEVARRTKPSPPQSPKALTRLAVSRGADWPKAWLRMRTRLEVSAEADQAWPATGFGRRYLPVGVKEKTM